MFLEQLPVFFLDLQTTGANPKSGEVLEIAWGQNPQDIRSSLVIQESGYIPYHIQKLTGITEADLVEARSSSDLKAELLEFKDIPCIIHFAQFEIPFLKSWFDEQIPFPIFCTHEIAKRLFPNLPTRSLKGMAGFFGHQKEDVKRAPSHTEATMIVWRGLVEELKKQNILTLEDLQNWLAQDFKRKKSKYEYPLSKEIRLGLSKSPGVYRMINKSGEILYVGKATSLHSRVNSYFRGQKNRDTKKLEMLTQVWNLQVTECKSPLEAALLETDEIKRLNPPYNVSLKVYGRRLAFFNHDFSAYSHTQDNIFCIGPFSNRMTLDSVRNLSHSLRDGVFSSHIFYEPFAPEILQEGFELFCSLHQVQPDSFKNVRNILAFWIRLLKKHRNIDLENFELVEESALDEDAAKPKEDLQTEELLLTPQEMAEKFERHFLRAASAYLRSRTLTKLLDAAVEYPLSKKQTHTLYFRGGKRVSELEFAELIDRPRSNWQNLNVHDYDRMSVLFSELMKLKGRFNDSKEA